MTPDLPPQSCFDPHMDFTEIEFIFRVVNARGGSTVEAISQKKDCKSS